MSMIMIILMVYGGWEEGSGYFRVVHYSRSSVWRPRVRELWAARSAMPFSGFSYSLQNLVISYCRYVSDCELKVCNLTARHISLSQFHATTRLRLIIIVYASFEARFSGWSIGNG